MYGLFGGCTTLFHLAVRYPTLVLAFSLAGFASQVPANPGPGDRNGTAQVLSHIQDDVVKTHPGLTTEVAELRSRFDLSPDATESEIAKVLGSTDACTDQSVRGVMSDAERRREAAWLAFLDERSRGKPPK